MADETSEKSAKEWAQSIWCCPRNHQTKGQAMKSKYKEFPIVAPYRLIILCEHWHSGQASAMYSVLSTGRIMNRDILVSLSCELVGLIRQSDKESSAFKDYADMVDYKKWTEKILENFPE